MIFVAGKVVFFALAFGIPLLFHPLLVVLALYAVAGLVMGVVLSVVFQLAHCVEEAEFPAPAGAAPGAWSTPGPSTRSRRRVDFARRSRVAVLAPRAG